MSEHQDKADARTLLGLVRDQIAGPTASALERVATAMYSLDEVERLQEEIDDLEDQLNDAKRRLRKVEESCVEEKDIHTLNRLRIEFAAILPAA